MYIAKKSFFTLLLALSFATPASSAVLKGELLDARALNTTAIDRLLNEMCDSGLSKEQSKNLLEYLAYCKLILLKDQSANRGYLERAQEVWKQVCIPLGELERLKLSDKDVLLTKLASFLVCLGQGSAPDDKERIYKALSNLEEYVESLEIGDKHKEQLKSSFLSLFVLELRNWKGSFVSSNSFFSEEALRTLATFSQQSKTISPERQADLFGLLSKVQILQGFISPADKRKNYIYISDLRSALEQYAASVDLPEPHSKEAKHPEYRWVLIAAGAAGVQLFGEQLKHIENVLKPLPIKRPLIRSESLLQITRRAGALAAGALVLAGMYHIWNRKLPSKEKTLTDQSPHWTHVAIVFTIIIVVLAASLLHRDAKQKGLGKS